MNSVLEYGYVSLNKKNEELCGDKVEMIPAADGGATLVLADGMGSGVKANILSTLTSKILCTMAAANVPLEECIDTIAGSLPVCKQRGVAYSTFSLLSVTPGGSAYLAEFDNPPAILLHGGKYTPLERAERVYSGKKLYLSRFAFERGDVLLVMSDGVVHAGVGETLNFGWDVKEIREFAEIQYDPALSARTMASIMANACYELYGHRPGDDTTVLAVKFRAPLSVNMMIGPPSSPESDGLVVQEFMAHDGKKVVCGGTSSQVVARELKTQVTTSFDYIDKDVPPIGYINGIDLTCEGVLTLKKLLTYADKYVSVSDPDIKMFKGKDGASLLANLLLIDASEVNLFVGRGVNLAHEGLGIDNKTKLDSVVKLINILKSLNKKVEIKYY
ncbi:MAG: SpoIIE family protein phosphatase [Clostridia bacterium]|nr:SpoIIE family protein phosphatase [Clostridia bacterium]